VHAASAGVSLTDRLLNARRDICVAVLGVVSAEYTVCTAAFKMASPNTLLVERAARPAEWIPLPNGRLGLLLEDASKRRRVYLAIDGRTRLCEHGETASAISQYAAGSRSRPGGSACTCENVDGLTASRFAQPPRDWPHAPSYYSVLVARGAKEVELPGGRLARKLPGKDTGAPVYMLPCGNLRCAHGNSEATLRAIAKQPGGRRHPCGCTLGGRSWRRGRLQTLKTQRAF